MKIVSFYYIQYPDDMPTDPKIAASEVYIELAQDDGNAAQFDSTYSLMVLTLGYLQEQLKIKPSVHIKKTIVVSAFADEIIRDAIGDIINDIEDFATKIE